ncbi:RNA-guided endonuclease InsQ/TnpB family protein [Nocardiopsis valliformis]|uniref:RNA-guided endonuclease InsQ/TnpB family protein n=1 Tax=Nocardiopsis valliformis TaxID=239974 RepID=UPI00034A88EB|nr:RNA-guided endonuclease TnpB family protein [Nocardiopsis valliformis]
MRLQRGHKARLDLTRDQAALVEDQGHAARALWNLLHDWWTMASENRRVPLADADAAIKQARKDIPWLAALPAQAAQQVLKTYFNAWRACWAGQRAEPRFKARMRTRAAIDVPQGRDLQIVRLNRRWGQVKIPKVGRVKFRWTRDLPIGKQANKDNRITGARLVREVHGWHIVFRVQRQVEDPAPHEGPTVGIDRGIAKPLALSDGTFREHGPWMTDGETERLRRLEKKAARQRRARKQGERTSNRLKRTYDQICGLRARAKRRALDWQHKTTTELARGFSRIGVEDLNIQGMTRSARGSVETPGTQVRQKAGLNRAIAGQAWGRTVTLLEYKTAERGGAVVRVAARGTSQRCSVCGFITSGNRESQDRFVCKNPTCGHSGNADTNAANNIDHAAGLAVSVRGDLAGRRSEKREPPESPPQAA